VRGSAWSENHGPPAGTAPTLESASNALHGPSCQPVGQLPQCAHQGTHAGLSSGMSDWGRRSGLRALGPTKGGSELDNESDTWIRMGVTFGKLISQTDDNAQRLKTAANSLICLFTVRLQRELHNLNSVSK
jgi:hypothetical protein